MKLQVKIMKKSIIKFLKKEDGDLKQIMTMLVTAVLIIGLIVAVIFPMTSNVKETGKVANVHQRKINMIIENDDYIPGSSVKEYDKIPGVSVSATDLSGTSITNLSTIADTSIFRESSRSKDANTGKLSSISFTQVQVND